MKFLPALALAALLVIGWALWRRRVISNPFGLIGWGPPWDLRFVPGLVALVVLIIYVLAPHFRIVKSVSDLISGWFR